MTGIHNINLQRSVSMLILFAALFSQIQTLYACDLMAGEPKPVCCCEQPSAICPMADSCAMDADTLESQCCEVSYEAITDAGMINASTVDHLTLLLDSPQPPPEIGFQQFPTALLPKPSQRQPLPDQSQPLISGKQTYLLTRRLRI